MKVRKNVLLSIMLFVAMALVQFATPSAAFASGTVGSGTPGSCTEAALDSALAGGGVVNFDCGAGAHTITVTGTKVISSDTQINGGGLITISGGDAVRVFTVASEVEFTITGLTVSDGNVTGNGGGMLINTDALVTITKSTFKDNNVVGGYGGAIYVGDATLNISESSFLNNNADVTSLGILSLGGGAIQNNDGTVEILSSTFSGNTVTSPSADGGAIYNGDFDGGPGLPDANPDVMTIGNSTFYNNTLVGDTGTSSSSGGAIRSNGDITLAHNTFSNNDSGVTTVPGDEAGAVTFGNGTAVVVYNIFANSSSDNGPAYDCVKRTTVGSYTEIGSIIVSDFSCDGTYSSDPLLGAFQDNGGPTFTMAPGAGSDAIHNAGSCASGITTDQRGVSRPQPSGPTFCDIGAVEVDDTAPTTTIAKAGGQADPTNQSPVEYTVTFSEPVVGFTSEDLNLSTSTVGGTLTGVITGGPTVFNVAISGMTTPGDVTLSIDEDVLTDIALNGNDASTSSDPTVAYDATGPTVTIERAASQDDPTNDAAVDFTVVFDESVTGFTAADVTIDGTAGPTTKNVTPSSGTTYNVAVSGMTDDGTVTASVDAGAVSDALGNPSSASTTAEVNYDGTAPTVSSITLLDANPTNAASVQFLVTFSEDVNGTGTASNFALTQTGVAGAAVTDVTGTGTTRTVTVTTGTGNGTIRLRMTSSTDMADAAGNAVASLPFTTGDTYTIDKTPPAVVSINRVGSEFTNASSVEFLVTFNESINGGSTSNFALTQSGVSGALVTDVTGTGSTRTVTVSTGSGDGDIRLDLDNTAGLTDEAGNLVSNVPFTAGQSYELDRTIPTVTVEQKAGQNDPTNDAPILFTVTFSEDVSGFTNADVNVSSGTAVLTEGPKIYTVSVNGMADGILTVSVPANAAIDIAGNNNSASTSGDNAVTFDTTAPTVTINKKAGQSDPAATSPIEFTVVFSEDVTGFTNSDVLLSGTANPSSAVVTSVSATTYNVAVSGMTKGGTVTAALASGAAKDAALNESLAGTSSDNIVEYDPDNPTVTITLADGQVEPLGFSPANFTVVFSEPIAGFTSDDVELDGTAGATTATVTEIVPGTTYNVAVSGMTSSGTAIISIPENAVEDAALRGNLPSSDVTVTFLFVKPGVPGLTAPANGVIVSDLQPLLNWNDSNPGAQYYQIQISTVQSFASTVIDESNVDVSEFMPPADLTPGVRYYWRVRGINAIGTASAWSTVRNFRTPLETPVLASPIGGVLLDIDRPTFDWNDIPGAANYTLQISTTSNFSTGLITRTVPGSSYVMPSDLAQKKIYHWRVMAKTSVVSSGWSVKQSFKTGNPPAVPVLVTPITNARVTILNPLFDWSNSKLPLPGGSTVFKHYQIQVADNPAFDTPLIDKEISGTPASSQYQSIDPDDGLEPDKQYYWRVRAVNDVDLTAGEILNYSAWSKVFIFRSAMEEPVLVAPADVITPALTTRRPAFDWQDTTGTTSYQIQISQFANMSTPLVNVSVPTSEYTPTADLPTNKTLFWRVRAKGPNGPSLWSAIWTFKTGNPSSVPTLLTPADNALSTIEQPVFDWSHSTEPAGTEFKYYEFQVDDDSDFSSPAIHEFIEDRVDSRYMKQPTDNLDANTTYYWRVRAVNDTDLTEVETLHYSSWSTVWRLRISLVAPTGLSPTGTINAQPDTFDWNAVPDATGYTIQVSTSSTFTTLLVNATLPGTSYDPANLPVNKTIYWRVRANGANRSGWSVGQFIIDTTP